MTGATTNLEGRSSGASPSDKSAAHVPLIIATAGALYFGLKLLILTGGDVQTATAMASRLEFLPTLAAMIISIAPMVLLPFIYFVTPGVIVGAPGSNVRAVAAFIYSILIVAGTLFSSLIIIAVAVGYMGSKKIAAIAKKKGRWKFFAIDVEISSIQPVFAAILLPAIFFSSATWIAPEALTLKGADPVQAYVVSHENDELVYLRGDTKTLVRTNADLVEKQEFCIVGKVDLLSSPIYRLWSGSGTYPECPKAA